MRNYIFIAFILLNRKNMNINPYTAENVYILKFNLRRFYEKSKK